LAGGQRALARRRILFWRRVGRVLLILGIGVPAFCFADELVRLAAALISLSGLVTLRSRTWGGDQHWWLVDDDFEHWQRVRRGPNLITWVRDEFGPHPFQRLAAIACIIIAVIGLIFTDAATHNSDSDGTTIAEAVLVTIMLAGLLILGYRGIIWLAGRRTSRRSRL
jgi:hypothetical protein